MKRLAWFGLVFRFDVRFNGLDVQCALHPTHWPPGMTVQLHACQPIIVCLAVDQQLRSTNLEAFHGMSNCSCDTFCSMIAKLM